MVSLFLTHAALFLQTCQFEVAKASGSPTIVITTAKENVVPYEPISLTLTIVNRAGQPIVFSKYYPRFHIFSDDGKLSFSDPKGRLVPKLNERQIARQQGLCVVGGGRWAEIVLSPGESWRETIYLQRYVKQPVVGAYSLDYRIEFPYRLKDEAIDGSGTVATASNKMAGRGRVNFKIQRGTADELQDIIDHHASLLYTKTGYRAEEALCVIENPIVVRQLVKMLSNCRSHRHTLEALSRFSNNKDALEIVRACLREDDPQTTANALSVLSKWGQALQASEIERLRKSSNPTIRRAVLKYIHMLKESRGPAK